MKKNLRILIIDDEPQIRKFLRISFEAYGHKIEEVSTGNEGLKILPLYNPDLIILDLGLPDIDGIDVLKKIRENNNTPVIILSVRNEEQTIISALDLGANDYLTKPFSIGELLARIRVIFRNAMDFSSSVIYTNGPLKVDFNSRLVFINEEEVKLTSTEYDLLTVFIKYAGKILTHRQILKEVWGPNSVEHSQYLRVYVMHLRHKLDSMTDKTQFIKTEPGIGYRFQIV